MKANINGINIDFTVTGEGPAVLLIHGFPLNHRLWLPQAEALAKAGYQVITPDLRGFGASEVPDGPYSMDIFADDMIALLNHLGIEQSVVGGMSMGGYVLLNMLERYPERVAAAVFMVTKSGADDEAGRQKRTLLAQEALQKGPKAVADIFAGILFADATLTKRPELVAEVRGWMEGCDPKGVAGALLAMRDRKDYTLLLPQFRLPAVAIGASEDKAIPPVNTESLAAGLADCRCSIIPAAGHMVTMEQADAVNSLLLDFLARVVD